jgi:DNA-binding NarL/FixJ family response regulator
MPYFCVVEIKVIILNSNFIIKTGLETILEKIPNLQVYSHDDSNSPHEIIKALQPDVVLMDYCSENYSINDLEKLLCIHNNVKIIGITEMQSRHIFQNAIKLGIHAHVLNCCDEEEVNGAIHAVTRNERFFCGKILEAIDRESKSSSCDPVSLSIREQEIIKYIAEGKKNKEIAEDLCISAHTVMTHRKNIMSKLGVKNTAGIVVFAVKENLIVPNKFLFDATSN